MKLIVHWLGIGELVPMFVSDDQMLWAGSNLIAIEKGGYLLVHNDVCPFYALFFIRYGGLILLLYTCCNSSIPIMVTTDD